jgi:tryptophanyl-tRNA synthetase
VALQDDYDCIYSVVDLHAITVRQDATELRRRCLDQLSLYIALGLDPQKNLLFMQSHVSAHAELSWMLGCYTYFGELSRMTQFKDKSSRYSENINAGLFTYPVLMAADVLLYQTDLVPIGEDQKQHMELCRDVAVRFNNLYGDVFKVPEVFIPKVGARIMSLQEPEKKMSKSESGNLNNVVSLLDEPNVIMNKFKRAMTDSGSEVLYSKDKPGVSNLLNIYCAMTGKTIAEAEKDFAGKGYGDFKAAVGESVVSVLKPVQEELKRLSGEKEYIDQMIKTNGERANAIATRTLRKVQKKIGFPPQL